MKKDLLHKRQRLGRHIPGFPKSSAIDYCETDRLLRHYLAQRVGRLCDGLSELPKTNPSEVARAIQELDRLRAKIEEDDGPQKLRRSKFSSSDEERLLDFDLVLLEKIAGLDSCLLELETTAQAGRREALFDRFAHGVSEVQELVKKRAGLWRQLVAGD